MHFEINRILFLNFFNPGSHDMILEIRNKLLEFRIFIN